tara:strand:+ start:2327 stop:3169 length:843 start_codon:yes stop_codon:yes gene_type:complete
MEYSCRDKSWWDNINWYNKHLCEYYNIIPQEALKLGTRSTGRTPSLPGSKTCKPVLGLTYEDIWDLSPRKTEEEIFKFYKDQGSWSTFRQCVRHTDNLDDHLKLFEPLFKNNMHIVEYGCGIAPFLFTLVNSIPNPREINIDISLTDVDCEHLIFGHWRMGKLLKEKKYNNYNLYLKPVDPNKLPTYNQKIDLAIVYEVFEHVPDPIKVAENLRNQMNPNGLLVENFVKHDQDEEDDGPDLLSARIQRTQYYEYLNTNFTLVLGEAEHISPSGTRIWKKK